MPESRKIVVPDALAEYLNINEDTVNQKMQEAVNRRAAIQNNDQMFDESDMAKDYLDIFTKEEILAMFMHASSEAGLFYFKILELQDKANIPLPLFQKIMQGDLPTEDQVARMYRGEEEEPEEEDFI